MKPIEHSNIALEKIEKEPKTLKEQLEGLQSILKTRGEQSEFAGESLGFNMERTNRLAGIDDIGELTEKYGSGAELKNIAFEKGLIA